MWPALPTTTTTRPPPPLPVLIFADCTYIFSHFLGRVLSQNMLLSITTSKRAFITIYYHYNSLNK
jgi:hypothetical protein